MVVQIVNSCTFVPFWQVIEGIEDMYFSEDGDVSEVELLVWCIICGQRVIAILPDCVWGTKVVAIVVVCLAYVTNAHILYCLQISCIKYLHEYFC